MSLGDVAVAWIQHPAVLTYLGLLALSAGLALRLSDGPLGAQAVSLGLPALAVLLIYPVAEYLLHRFVLHARFLYRSPHTVRLWKRIHYDHHADPDDLRVLFCALHTTLPTLAVVTLPVGLALGGTAGGAAAVATGLACLLVYEFCHAVDHLPYLPRNRLLARLKRHHLLHHFHNDRGNYGITSLFVDRLADTHYERAGVPTSDTVFNLGYDEAEQRRYPWLAQVSPAVERTRRLPPGR